MSTATNLAGLLIAAAPLLPGAEKDTRLQRHCAVDAASRALGIQLYPSRTGFESSADEPRYMVSFGFKDTDGKPGIGPQDSLQWADFREIIPGSGEADFGKTARIELQDGRYMLYLNTNFVSWSDELQDYVTEPVAAGQVGNLCAAAETAASFIKKPQHRVLTAIKDNLGITPEETGDMNVTATADNPYGVQVDLTFRNTDGEPGIGPGDVLQSGRFVKLDFGTTGEDVTLLQAMVFEQEPDSTYKLYFNKGGDAAIAPPQDGRETAAQLTVRYYGHCRNDTDLIKAIAPIMKLPRLD